MFKWLSVQIFTCVNVKILGKKLITLGSCEKLYSVGGLTKLGKREGERKRGREEERKSE